MAYFEQTRIANTASIAINPATEDTLATLNAKFPVLTNDGINVVPKNITTKFREAFEKYTPGVVWNEVKATGDMIFVDGNAASASYLVISKNPLVAGNDSSISLISTVNIPVELSIGLSISQRTSGQEFNIELVDTDSPLVPVADLAINTITQTTTVLTVDTVADHGLSVGKSIGIFGCVDTRVNYPALVVASVPSPRQFTVTAGPGGTIPSLTVYVTQVVAATTAALPTAVYANGTLGVGATLTASANGAFPAQDDITLTVGQRVLVKNQVAGAENGIYTLTVVGNAGAPWVLTRATDFDVAAEMVVNSYVSINQGTTQATRRFVLAATVTTVGTTAATFNDLGAGSANNTGFVYFRERMSRAQNGISQIFEQISTSQSSMYVRSEAGDALPSGTIAGSHAVTVGTTAPVQLVNSAYQYAFTPTTEYRIFAQTDRIQWADSPVDSLAQTTSRLLRTQVCVDPTANYRLKIRAVNNKSLTVPNAQIVSAVKTASTTATIITDVAHGLIVGDPVVQYGIRAQGGTEFPNLLVATSVASIVNSTTFTIVNGTVATTSSYGGYVAKVQGGNLMSALGGIAQSIQSATLITLTDSTRQMVLTGSGNWTGLTIGDGVNVIGCRNIVDGATIGVDGVWKVANIATTTLTLVPMPNNIPPADFALVNCGGAIIKRTEMRLSFVRLFDYERQRVEMLSRSFGDIAASVPVVLQGGVTAVNGSLSGVTTVSAVTSSNLGIPTLVTDVASAALTTTTTVAAITPGFGISYQVNIPVTAVTGTNPTLDVSIEESDDSGTNWFKVYDYPRITAAGLYRSPIIPLIGNRIRYVQTTGGTTPSFTRAINRLQSSHPANSLRQLIDRSVVLTTLNSVTPSLNVQNSGNQVKLVVNVGAITTTAPQLQLEGTEDGTNWVSIGSPLTAVASSTVLLNVSGNNWLQIRARVSTAGVGVTPGYVLIKGHD